MPARAGAERPAVVVLAMGGTIAAAADSSATTTQYSLAHGVKTMLSAVPEMQDYARVSGEQVANVASQEIDGALLLKLAQRVNAVLAEEGVSGVVITHGTDTMEETAYFLNLVVKSDKPVVVLGAMRPSTALSADGPMNLLDGIKVAAAPQSTGKGVLVVLNGRIVSARHAVKSHTSAVDAFRLQGTGELGSVLDQKVEFDAAPLRRHTVHTGFDVNQLTELPQVEILYGHQGMGVSLFEAAIEAGARGIVFAATGNGTMSEAAKRGAAKAAARGVAFVRSTRVGGGTVSERSDDCELGTVAANSLNPQKARVLLSVALTVTNERAKLQRYFQEC